MIEVLDGGALSMVQDGGRPGFRHLGIPLSGAADRLSLALANWMVGNPWNYPALETTLGGLKIRCHTDLVAAVAGADMGAQKNGKTVKNFSALSMQAGDNLSLSHPKIGCRAYIALAGGLSAEQFLGSQSTYIPAKLGGIEGRALEVGDRFLLKKQAFIKREIPTGYRPSLSNHIILRAMPGPEFSKLSLASQRALFIKPFMATPQSNRMGCQLKGNRVKLAKPKSMISGPLLPGTLQIPPKGPPILALVDGHCTGGYPRALQVIRADHWQMGQIAPGMKVSFRRAFGDSHTILKHRKAHFGFIDGFEF